MSLSLENDTYLDFYVNIANFIRSGNDGECEYLMKIDRAKDTHLWLNYP
jgi:hypothetical protein